MALTNLALEATIVANGKIYPGWTSIEVWREYMLPTSYMKFTAAEDENFAASYSVVPGDPAQGFLCGIPVITGYVMTSQVVFDKGSHAVEIVVASQTQNAIIGTVQNNPGQYKNQTFQQMASAVLSKVGVNLRMAGDTSGADIPFLRVSEHIGERAIDFVHRLAAWRNLYLVDDSQGNLVATRGTSGGSSGATLVEGQNIESARRVLSYDTTTDRLSVTTQQSGNDQTNGMASSQVFASAAIANYKGPSRPVLFLGEMPASQQEIQLRLNHAVGLLNLDVLEATITVPGWLQDNGSLWISLVGDAGSMTPITIYSPMLFPSTGGQAPSPGLFVKGVKHLQDTTGGTRTEITCCIQTGLVGGGDAIGF
jgi:prophage tail gpP-like protein